jgi:alpha-1,6-mannosyltransferase
MNDAEVMAANILEVWNSDRAEMGAEAAEHARQFSWDHSMDALFARVYPNALAQAAERRRVEGATARRPLAEAR